MTVEHISEEDPRVQAALAELRGMISERWPSASFLVTRGEDNPEGIHLNATVDVEDPDDVVDLVIERLLDLHDEQGLPIHVIPLRPAERLLQEFQAERTAHSGRRWGAMPGSPGDNAGRAY